MQFQITQTQDGMLLRDFLKKHCHLSHRMTKRLKYSEGGITVDGRAVTVRHVLREGELLTLAAEDAAPTEKIRPVDLPLDILYEDGELVVPAKPADMPTHPSHDHYDDTVANALCYRYEQMGVPFCFRPINRLDRDTSGLLLIARGQIAADRLNRAMREGRIRKSYLAILEGAPSPAEGEIETHLCRTAESIIVRRVCTPEEGGDRALTRYRTLAVSGGYALVEASPITGRTHQLRVHFAHIGHPIVGDSMYGHPHPDMPRQALHAHTLTFPHPTDGREISARAPLPEDMLAFLRKYLKQDARTERIITPYEAD
ncbi:MAG: RluA family pseudouridine synthase [Clostridia bacterium]|nr:RluA family pseudouridine synthase [Clostridia bacterium]